MERRAGRPPARMRHARRPVHHGRGAHVRRRDPRWHHPRRQRRGTVRGRRRHPRRQHRRGGAAGGRARPAGDRCPRARRRARLHQHAELGHRVAVRGRARAERRAAGRHARGVRRGDVDGSAQRGDEAADGRGAGGHPLPGHLDHPRPVSRDARAEGGERERRVVRRRDDGARPRAGLRRPRAHRRRAGAHAAARAPGDGGGRAGGGLLAHLRARVLRQDGRADRAP